MRLFENKCIVWNFSSRTMDLFGSVTVGGEMFRVVINIQDMAV